MTRARRTALIAVAVAALALAGVVSVWLLTGSDRAFLGPSGPAETVLRAVRLAGFEHAAVGEAQGAALLRLDLAALTSAPDAEIAWQAGLATLSSAYPDADAYAVQLAAEGLVLAEIECAGPAAREAVAAGDAAALRAALGNPRLFAPSAAGERTSSEPDGEVIGMVPPASSARALSLSAAHAEGALELPLDARAIDVHLAGGYLDAKNRAAGLLDETGPLLAEGRTLKETAARVRSEAPGVPAPAPGDRVVGVYAERLSVALGLAGFEGGQQLLAEIGALGPDPGRAAVTRARAYALVAESLALPPAEGLLLPARDLARMVATSALIPGPLSDGVLASAGAASAPEGAVDVREFGRAPGFDVAGVDDAPDEYLPGRVIRLHGRSGARPSLVWTTAEGGDSVAPDIWLAYERGDRTRFWLAGSDGDVALVDGSLRGWAFSRGRAALVEASRVGTVLAHFSSE